MDEYTLIEDIRSLLRSRGVDVIEGDGQWPLIVHAPDGGVFGISVEDASYAE